jgi:hypothetical protein
MKKVSIQVFSLLFCFLFFSFQQNDNENSFTPLMQERYDKAVKNYFEDRHKKCLETILNDAESYVDSVIINEINILLLDTIIFPEKPAKPSYPDTIILNDSVLIQPK